MIEIGLGKTVFLLFFNLDFYEKASPRFPGTEQQLVIHQKKNTSCSTFQFLRTSSRYESGKSSSACGALQMSLSHIFMHIKIRKSYSATFKKNYIFCWNCPFWKCQVKHSSLRGTFPSHECFTFQNSQKGLINALEPQR